MTNPRGLPTRIVETGVSGGSAVVDFTYDARGRLIHEVRTGNTPYDLAYEYDAGGNRTRKVDALGQREVVYHYDLEDPLRFASANNRLEYAEEFGWVGGMYDLVATTWYDHAHNVTRVTRHEEGGDVYTAVRLGYARNERTVASAAGESWHWDGNSAHAPTGYQVTWARQFRYDSGRSRYLSRKLDPAALQGGQFVVLEDVWTDFDEDAAYGDYAIFGAAAVSTALYEPGLGLVADAMATNGPPVPGSRRACASPNPGEIRLHAANLGEKPRGPFRALPATDELRPPGRSSSSPWAPEE